MAYMSRAMNPPKSLQAVSIVGADGMPINPGDGVIADGSGRTTALNFGIYLGTTGTGYKMRIYYECEVRTWDKAISKWTPSISCRYIGSNQSAKHHTRICGIPAGQAQSAMKFQL